MNKRTMKRCLVVALAMITLMLSALTTVSAATAASVEGVTMKMVRPAIELFVDEVDKLTVEFKNTDDTFDVTFQSADPSVVAVQKDGTVTARKLGETTVTATSAALDQSVTCRVEVVEKKYSFDDNIMLSVFWPTELELIGDEQWQLMADAGINWVGPGVETLCTPEIQARMLELCHKYGMGMDVTDSAFGGALTSKTDEEIAADVARYHNVPGAYGFQIVDEPYNPNYYIGAYLGLKKAAPDAYMHLNFLPNMYGSSEKYQAQMNDWCRLGADAGYPQEYLMFDRYPFWLEGGMDRWGFFSDVRDCYEVGLANDVKTALYIQTVCQEVAFRRPDDDEIRYEMYASLAFGFKQLSFFTWITPTNRSEPFVDGIIAPDGTPNEHYETVKTINHEILNIGPTLVKCDALGVYFNGPDTYGQPSVPADFFVQGSAEDSMILSWMRHKETGRNYLMVVNNDYDNAQDVTLTFDDEINSLSEVSRTDGTLQPLAMSGQNLDLTLAAGDAMLIALPESFDYYEAPTGQPDASVNLARDAMITAPTSVGADGWYIVAMQDGRRCDTGEENALIGWKMPSIQSSCVNIDLKRELNINRVDLYTVGNWETYGMAECGKLEILVSSDGENWRTVKTLTDPDLMYANNMQINFEETSARYIRITFDLAAFYEIEVYCDDGTVPAPEAVPEFVPEPPQVITYEEGDNIALGKKAFCSSTMTADYLSLEYINDGRARWGWRSNGDMLSYGNFAELVGVDFGDLFAVEKIVLVDGGLFPEDYTVELSVDGRHWTVVSDVKGAEDGNNASKTVIELETPVNARMVRVKATKMRDNYMQLGDLEAYGKPVCDKTVLEKAVAVFEYKNGDKSASAYTDAVAALDNANLTQTQADGYVQKLLVLVGLTPDNMPDVPKTPDEPDTEPVETTPVTDAPATEDAVTTAPATSADVTTEATGGCGSVIGMSVAAAVAAVASAVLACRRRRRDEEA